MLERLGKYELRGSLGKGAMGTVYDAWDPGIARRVAIKTIPLPQGDKDAADAYDRFRREAQAAGRLSHSGIVAVYDSGEAEGVAYIVMELVEGESLKSLLDREHRLSPSKAVEVMTGLLDALSYSHGRGVIHRDVKPTNIMLTKAGDVKIADFGIARIENSEMTQVGTIMGSPAYMSPEQFMGQAVDARTDVYSSGVVLYQLLTGEKPFQGGMTAIMHKVLHTDPPRPSEVSVTAPPALDTVIATAMARRPEDRYASAAAFSAALHAALVAASDPVDDATQVLTRPTPTLLPDAKPPQPAPPPRAKPRRAVWLGAGAAVLLLAGTAAWLLRPAPPVQTAAMVQPQSPPPIQPQPYAVTNSPPVTPVPPSPVTPPVSSLPVTPPPVTPPPVTLSPVQPPATQTPVAPPEITTPIMAPTLPPEPPSIPVRTVAAPATYCTALETAVTGSGAGQRLTVTGAAGADGPEAAARAAIEAAWGRTSGIDWQVSRFNGPYCPVVNLVRALNGKAGEFAFTVRNGGQILHDRDLIVPVLTAPGFPAHLRLSYFQQNGTVDHLVQPRSGPPYPPGAPITLAGQDNSGGWQVGPPFGNDMMLAIMSSAPLKLASRPEEESSEIYLAALQRAADAAKREGVTVLARVVVLQTEK